MPSLSAELSEMTTTGPIITPDTPVQLPAKLLYTAFAVLGGLALLIIGGGWAVISTVTGGLRGDVQAIRSDVSNIQTALSGLQGKELSDLKVQMAGFTASVTSVSLKFDTMNKSMEGLAGQIADMKRELVSRPASFNPDQLRSAIKEYGADAKVIVLVPGLMPSPK